MSPNGKFRQVRFELPPGATDILLVRHGESAAHDPDRPFALVDGHGDPELHPDGRLQAERVADRLADADLAALYVTSLRRTAETAAPLAGRVGLEPVVERDLREVYLGEWEGGAYRARVAANDPLLAQVLAEERWDVIPGAEPSEAFRDRVVGAVERIAAAHVDRRVAVFTHGGVIGALLAHAASSRPFAFVAADNASISQLVVQGGRWSIRRFNDVAHVQAV